MYAMLSMLAYVCPAQPTLKKIKKKLAGGELGFLTPGCTLDLRYLKKNLTSFEFKIKNLTSFAINSIFSPIPPAPPGWALLVAVSTPAWACGVYARGLILMRLSNPHLIHKIISITACLLDSHDFSSIINIIRFFWAAHQAGTTFDVTVSTV